MLRFVVILLAGILLISVVRSIVSAILHGFSEMMKTPPATPQSAGRPNVPVAGELKKDPVCGTYVSTASAFKNTAGAETIYFCSRDCQDRYRS